MYTLVTALLLAALAATPALADKGKSKSWNGEAHASGFCPPGLAKKNPPCVPPGLAKRDFDDDHDHDDLRIIRIGDIIDDRFVLLEDPLLYGLGRDYFYYRALDRIFRVDPETRQVLAFIGFIDALLN